MYLKTQRPSPEKSLVLSKQPLAGQEWKSCHCCKLWRRHTPLCPLQVENKEQGISSQLAGPGLPRELPPPLRQVTCPLQVIMAENLSLVGVCPPAHFQRRAFMVADMTLLYHRMLSVYLEGWKWDYLILVHASPLPQTTRSPTQIWGRKSCIREGSGVRAYAGAGWHFPLRGTGGCVLWCRKEAANEHLVPRGAGGKDQQCSPNPVFLPLEDSPPAAPSLLGSEGEHVMTSDQWDAGEDPWGSPWRAFPLLMAGCQSHLKSWPKTAAPHQLALNKEDTFELPSE